MSLHWLQKLTEEEVIELAENVEYRRLPQDGSTRASFLLEFAQAVLASSEAQP